MFGERGTQPPDSAQVRMHDLQAYGGTAELGRKVKDRKSVV